MLRVYYCGLRVVKSRSVLLTVILFTGFKCVSFAQLPKTKHPEKPFDQYGKLLGKDIGYVMNIANIKDTVGKTSLAYFPQGQKTVQYRQLKTPTGELLGFDKKNKLVWVGPRP